MDANLHALGRILLNAVPTFLIVLFLVLYLRRMFFKPLAEVLRKRYEETEGARRAAEESIRDAEKLTSEYEEMLRQARHEIYADQDRYFRDLEHKNAEQIHRSRREAELQVARATDQLKAEAEAARRDLEARSAELAEQIADRVLQGRAA